MLATGIVTLYLLDVDYKKENAPKSDEDFDKWLDNRVLDQKDAFGEYRNVFGLEVIINCRDNISDSRIVSM